MKRVFSVFFLILALSIFVACNKAANIDTSPSPKIEATASATTETEGNAMYHKITAEEAKTMMTEETNYILLDVRTKSEYDDGHIDGSILLPNDQIASKIGTIIPDKTQLVLIYCRSGNRSAQAAKVMVSMGYTNVYDFGGIIDWPYETVK